ALIDDVITTSATLNAIVPLLFRAGARSVEVWAICRTL
ncbi:DNA utilization protein GntX, partial [Escherichia coli]